MSYMYRNYAISNLLTDFVHTSAQEELHWQLRSSRWMYISEKQVWCWKLSILL